ncbi:hypothetical protein ACHAW5_008230 [Stephanodiscus triporus]|uniref:Uncharacterized protein n=1 Tax=Stephanodiscus triporus TaxID=2934178 RepID=A0ABD3MJ49_9STRA
MASSSYDVQLQIRRAAEERSAAHQDLVSWIDHVAVQGCKETDKKRTTKASENINAKDHSTTSLKDAQISSIDRSQCEDERLRGNNFFALGNYHDAIACYTRCLGNKDALTSPLVYSNRAIAHLKLKSWVQAEADATLALQIDPLHFKSYQRRCVARLAMGKVRAAMQDICAATDAATADDPSAESSLAEIQELRTTIEKKLAELPTKCPRRKIPITIV